MNSGRNLQSGLRSWHYFELFKAEQGNAPLGE